MDGDSVHVRVCGAHTTAAGWCTCAAHVRVCAHMLVRTTAVRVPALVVAAHVVLLVLPVLPVLLVLPYRCCLCCLYCRAGVACAAVVSLYL